MDTRKRGRTEYTNGGGFKKSKPEMDSLSSGIGSKSKPCTKFFSVSGCPFGENCHFLHHVPGGYNAVAQMMNLSPSLTPRALAPPLHPQNGCAPPTAVKTKVCNRFKSEGHCKFGDKCHFAHGEWELGRPIGPTYDDPREPGPMNRFSGRMVPPLLGPAASFGASTTAKISVDVSFAGSVIGKGGVNSKQICRQTGVKLAIRDHETDPNLRNIELEGTLEQVQQASEKVWVLIGRIRPSGKGFGGSRGPGSNNLKTKLCENFAKGSCTFGERCHFAHGAAELRSSG